MDGRLVAIIPARGGDDAPERAIAQAEKRPSSDCDAAARRGSLVVLRRPWTPASRHPRGGSLDPGVTEERERLGFGIKAYRVLAAQLPR